MKFLGLFLALLAVVISHGCKQATKPASKEQPGPVRSVMIVLNADTVHYLTGDTVRVLGHARVSDAYGSGIGGIHVLIWPSGTAEGIRYSAANDSGLSDGSGTVAFTFWSLPSAGQSCSIVRAQSGTVIAADSIRFVAEGSEPGELRLDVSKTLVFVHPLDFDSVIVQLTLLNSERNPVRAVQPVLRISGGVLSTLPPTDAQGHSFAVWYTTGAPIGSYCLTASYERLQDTTWIEVDTPPVLGRIDLSLDHDTLKYAMGDTAVSPGLAHIADTRGRSMAGVPVSITLEQSIGSLELSNPSGWDTSDAYGNIPFRLSAWRETSLHHNMIVARGGDQTGGHVFVVRPVTLTQFHLQAETDTLHFWYRDSLRVDVTLTGTQPDDVIGLPIHSRVQMGYLSPLSPADEHGATFGYWRFDTLCCPDSFASYFVTAHAGQRADTAWIVFDARSGGDR